MLAIDYARDIAIAEADLPQTVTISGVEYPAVVSDAMRAHALEMPGYMPDADLSFIIRIAVLPSVANDARVVHGGKTYRAESVVFSPCGTAYEVKCTSAVK